MQVIIHVLYYQGFVATPTDVEWGIFLIYMNAFLNQWQLIDIELIRANGIRDKRRCKYNFINKVERFFTLNFRLLLPIFLTSFAMFFLAVKAFSNEICN
jgi:uncharacterized membrane protein (DUF485 family)